MIDILDASVEAGAAMYKLSTGELKFIELIKVQGNRLIIRKIDNTLYRIETGRGVEVGEFSYSGAYGYLKQALFVGGRIELYD